MLEGIREDRARCPLADPDIMIEDVNRTEVRDIKDHTSISGDGRGLLGDERQERLQGILLIADRGGDKSLEGGTVQRRREAVQPGSRPFLVEGGEQAGEGRV